MINRALVGLGITGFSARHWPGLPGQQQLRRVFRKAVEQHAQCEIDYLLAIKDRTRMGVLRCR